MVGCAVIGCKSNSLRKEADVAFHAFPTDDKTRKYWIAGTGKKNWVPHKYSKICSKHFEQHCFRKTQKRTFLEEFSIPTLFIHKFPVSWEVRVEPLPTESMDCQSQPDTHAQQHSATAKSVIKFAVSREVRVEPLPTEPMDCQSKQDTHAQQHSATAKSVIKFAVSREVRVEPLPTEPMDCQSKHDTHAQQHSATAKSVSKFAVSQEVLVEPLPTEPMDCQSQPDTHAQQHSGTAKSIECTEDPTMTPRKLKLTLQLNRKTLLAESRRKKIEALRSKSRRLQKKNAQLLAIIENLKTKRFINQESADLLATLNNNNSDFLGSNKSKFSPEVRKFALNLHFISARAYNFVRKHFNTCLPHTRTLARWYQTVDAEPGFSTESLEALKLLAKSNPNKKLVCGLCFDEMAIRKSVDWDGKQYVGFMNLGQDQDTGADKDDGIPLAKEALVFMLTCLNGSWKLPVGHFLINGICAEQKASLVKMCIDLVSECGVDIVAVTFDGCAANLSMARVLGCELNSERIDPVFTHKGKKVAIFPDPSHMLKLTRNTLGDKSFLIDGEEQTIAFDFIRRLVELQENEGCHLANKIRGAHINYKKQIMKVKLAAQIFSESVANSIEYCKDNLKLEEFQNSEATIKFIRKINSLFDILNSRNLNDYGCKQPLTPINIERMTVILNDTYDYVKSLKLGTTNILKTQRKTGFLGFMIDIKSLLFLYREHVQNGPLKFLSTYKLSQDHLEMFFSAIRSKGGYNNNPTAAQFKAAFKRLIVHGELKHLTTGNCVPLSEIAILTCTKPEISINKTAERHRLIDDDIDLHQTLNSELVVSKDHDYIADPTRLTEFSKTVVSYIAGFVVKALEKQLKCQECLSVLPTTEKNVNTLLHKKDKGGLHYPSKSVVKICEIAEEAFKANKISAKKDHMHYLLQKCLKRSIGLNFFSEMLDSRIKKHFQGDHYALIIKAICQKYLNVRIHYNAKTMLDKEEKIRNMYTKLILFKGQ